jgi:penicillin-binding protein 2
MSLPLSNRLDDSDYRTGSARALQFFLIAAVALLVGRLFYLQIIKGAYHAMLSTQNSMRLQIVKAPRGLIYDRNGVVIARNRPSYQIAILPTQLKDRTQVLRNLLRFQDAKGAQLFDSDLVVWSLDHARWRKFQPLVILEDASFEAVAMVEEHQMDLPGVVTLVESRRSYPFGSAAGHALGYMDEVKEEEVDAFKTQAAKGESPLYGRGDRIGRKGLERRYEEYFRGRDGIRYVMVNAFGKEIEVIHEMPQLAPTAGKNVVTTLDMRLQCLAESLLSDTLRGAVVAIDPRNGEVLVMASSPRMDGNIFSLSRGQRAHGWAHLALDSTLPLNNRAISGGYEPGSTFKGVVSVAALQSGTINATTHMPRACNGGYRFGNRVWRCWDPRGHGSLGLVDAFTQSCDVYYYQVGLELGMDAINYVAREFGLGEKTGIDLEDERAGVLMDSTTYMEHFGKRGWRWSRGLILNLSIGQGQITTPIQLANYVAGLANGKQLYRPHLLREVQSPSGAMEIQTQPEVIREINLSPEEHAIILQAMAQVVDSPKGTAARARVPGILVGGKTGSAENPHGDKTHALFICAAPLDHPTIAIAVLIENVGHGGSFAAPIAGALLKRFFNHEPKG